ncbi:hypothetical protein BHU72_07530 [Desulfuribacillus stibiiarsenatis]|uniref:DNA 3'-5' helicase n=1 Tax=Desulfuribacillus stibiiarsenatis TaxID=1390249 RepID=A0A1E5L3M4_9FIRM|nr:UvrD-helicase domain-containing protein [Desulfuribacillus stibiiarsenatis]OEH84681.1 hypothetical protein BHU72_07530 [Desulfuribacillus stibiiarsenatis]
MGKTIVDKAARERIEKEVNTNFLVEAGAGSGKTTSLVQRMVYLIQSGTSTIDEIVAITYTRKAADDLKIRFQETLEKAWAKATNGQERLLLGNALQNMERCFIGTVHSFCARILRERPIEAGLDLNFKELEEEDDQEVLNEAWLTFIHHVQIEKLELLQEIREIGISDTGLFECLQTIKDYPEIRWVTKVVPKPALEGAFKALMQVVQEAKRFIPDTEPDKGYDSLQKSIISAVIKFRHMKQGNDAEIVDIFTIFDKELKPTYVRWNPASKEDVNYYYETISSLMEGTVRPLLQCWKEYCHPKLISFLFEALKEYNRIKKERSLLNFQDLLMYTTKVLRENAEVREYFQNKYKRLLVDEFQDTDPIQAEFMFYLTSENINEKIWTKCKPKPGSLFVVGDPKQAIYRFRRADIDTYNRVKDLIKSHGGDVLQLTMNFRTIDTVTTKLNEVFERLLPEQESAYQAAYRPLHSYHEDVGQLLSGIYQINVSSACTKKEDILHEDAVNIAWCIANYIKQGYQAKDFLVLTRYNEGITTYAQRIEEYRIPVSISGDITIGEMKEFKDLSILLRVFANPLDEVGILAALRGIFFGISDNELYQWKRAGGAFSLYAEHPELLDEKPEEKVKFALTKLCSYQKWVNRMLPSSAMEKIIEDVGFYPLLVNNQLGKRAYKGLMQILEALRAHEGANTTYKQGYELLDKLICEKTVVANIEGEENAVRIMNVHKAKGLEAPIVFLAHPAKMVSPEMGLNRHIRRQGDESEGYIAFFIREQFKNKELAIPPDWEQVKQEELRYLTQEEIRIVYVAATRAEKALIISSCAKDNKNPWASLLQVSEDNAITVPDDIEMECQQGQVVLIYEEYERNVNAINHWLEIGKMKTYDSWTPTENKEIFDPAIVLREAGGGKDWGIIIHQVLEKVVKGIDCTHYIKNIVRKYNLPAEREAEIWNYVQTFKETDVWQELQSAEEIHTEVPFAIKVTPGHPMYEQIQKSDTAGYPITIKGVIDLVYKYNGIWNIVDYKTDRLVNKEDYQLLTDYYQQQLDIYKQAWSQLSGKEQIQKRLLFI